jgi:hypothetical protein
MTTLGLGYDDFVFALRAGFPYFHIQSWEIDKTVKKLTELISNYQNPSTGENPYTVKVWDYLNSKGEMQDPEKVLEWLDKKPKGTIVIAKNFNWFMFEPDGEKPEKTTVSFLQNNIAKFQSAKARKGLIIVTEQEYDKAVPVALSKVFRSIEIPLPDYAELETIYNKMIVSAKSSKPDFVEPTEKEKQRIINGAKGLTAQAAQGAFSFSIIKDNGEFKGQTVERFRAEEIERTPGLKVGVFENAEFPIGYTRMQDFAMMSCGDEEGLGIIILGPGGVGKTMFTQALGAATGRRVIILEPEKLEGDGLVGQKEAAWGRAIAVISANAPCIVLIDEIEKGLAGVGGAGSQLTDSSTQKASVQLLKFLSDDRPKGVWVAATCNDISQMPAAWLRAERWDCAPFYVDFPGEKAKKEILNHYINHYNEKLKAEGSKHVLKYQKIQTENWTGAECKAVVKLAKMSKKQIKDIQSFVKPIAATSENEIKILRKFATPERVNMAAELEKSEEAFQQLDL